MEKIREFIDKVPWLFLMLGVLSYVGYDYFVIFQSDPSSPMVVKRTMVSNTQRDVKKLSAKIKEEEQFAAQLEQKKVELRQLATELDNLRGTLTDDLDIAGFMKMTVTEAKRVGMEVLSLRPSSTVERELFVEQPFGFKFRGQYPQILVFLSRVAKKRNIVKIMDFDLAVKGNNADQHILIEGTVNLSAFQYRRSKADDVNGEFDENRFKDSLKNGQKKRGRS